MTNEAQRFDAWVGKSETHTGVLTLPTVQAMSATLDRVNDDFSEGSELPPLWHWLFLLPAAAHSSLSEDGHPRRGEFLPPIELPRRMSAGGNFNFNHPLIVGEEISRRSIIKSIKGKQGRSGELVFVCVEHQITGASGIAFTEEHNIVFKEAAPATKTPADAPSPAPIMAPNTETFSKQINPDPVLLFRYSALTFNGHRIHYDRDYACNVEGYPGLIVHGPLMATLLIELLTEKMPAVKLKKFDYKALGPVFDTNSFTVCGQQIDDNNVQLWIRNHQGNLCMKGDVEIAAA